MVYGNCQHRKNIAMTTLNNRITINPDICNGKPTFRGKRITVQSVLEFLAKGDTHEDILFQFPSLEPEDITAAIQFPI